MEPRTARAQDEEPPEYGVFVLVSHHAGLDEGAAPEQPSRLPIGDRLERLHAIDHRLRIERPPRDVVAKQPFQLAERSRRLPDARSR